MFSNFIRYFLIPQIGGNAETGLAQRRLDLAHIRLLAFAHGHHDYLQRREPKRERARVILDEDADEALHRAHDGAVQHDGALARVVLVDELRAEEARHVEIDLHSAALPHAADRVLQ